MPVSCLTECLHQVLIKALNDDVKVGDKITCPDCGEEHVEVLRIYEENWEWHLRCRDCRFSRLTGQSETLAYFFANKHRSSKVGHRTKVERVFHDRND